MSQLAVDGASTLKRELTDCWVEMYSDTVKITLGIACVLLTIMLLKEGMILLAPAPAILAFCFLHRYLLEFIAGSSGGLFFSTGGGKSREQYSAVRGLLANREYREAVEALTAIVASAPDAAGAKLLLVNTLYEHLDEPDRALQIGAEELRSGRWTEDHDRIVMTVVDIYLDKRNRAAAVDVLQHAIAKSDNPTTIKTCERRLESLNP